MRYIQIVIVFLFCASCCAQKSREQETVDSHATKETKILFKNLQRFRENGIMFGHQDDLAYGLKWKYRQDNSDVKSVCGDYPAVYGWELGHIELGHSVSLDTVPFDSIRHYIRQVYERGGVNTVSWHANNPLTGGTAWDVSSSEVVKSILPGGARHELFKQWLDKLSAFFLSLKDRNGAAIPIIFRPYHEFSGSWFWWGLKLCTQEDYISLWHFTVEYLRDVKQVHNLLYAYSNTADFETQKQFLNRYPGDDYIDVLGFDDYQYETTVRKIFVEGLRQKLDLICKVAREKNKLPALTEIGFAGIPDNHWWTLVLWASAKNANISYVLLWRNAYGKPAESYVPYPGHPSAKDFVDFYKLKKTLFQKDLKGSELYK